MKFRHVYHEDYNEYEIPLDVEYVTVCCDCGLTHREIYSIRKGRLFFMGRRDNRATGQYRRFIKNINTTKNNI